MDSDLSIKVRLYCRLGNRSALLNFTTLQLCGGYADIISRCAQLLEEQCAVDFIDLNMGCPIDFIYRKVRAHRELSLVGSPEKGEWKQSTAMGSVLGFWFRSDDTSE